MIKQGLKQAWAHTSTAEHIIFCLFLIVLILDTATAIIHPSIATINGVITTLFILILMYTYATQKARMHHLTANTNQPH